MDDSDLLAVLPDLSELDSTTPEFPEDFESEPESSGPVCEICQTPIPWSGRGRKPKKCVDHKTRTTVRDTTSSPRPRRGARHEARLATIQDSLEKEFTVFGKTISKAMPVTGVTVVARGPKTAEALVAVASKNEKTLAALEAATKIVPVLELGETAVAVWVAVLMDMGRIEPGSLPAVMSGVQEQWDLIYPEDEQPSPTDNPQSNGRPYVGLPPVAVPPRFARVEV